MRNKFLLLGSIVIISLIGCSSKKYFNPKNIDSGSSALSSANYIINFNRDGATLESGVVLTKDRRLKLNLENGYMFINRGANGIVIANGVGSCKILNDNKIQEITFPKALLAGTVINNRLVYILRDNSFGIYDLSKKSIIYNNKAEKVYSIDARVANPLRVDNLVVIPLLNGKITILDLKSNKVVKEIFISTQNSLNNVIFLQKFKNTLVVATPHKVIAINTKGRREFKRDISEVVLDDSFIFVFSKDGKIFKLDKSLTVQDEKKFKFAHFSVSTIYKDRVYALDKQGYLIVSNKNFTKHRVYDYPEVNDYSFVSDGKIYYSGNKIELDRLSY
jgi:hypothetical protein